MLTVQLGRSKNWYLEELCQSYDNGAQKELHSEMLLLQASSPARQRAISQPQYVDEANMDYYVITNKMNNMVEILPRLF